MCQDRSRSSNKGRFLPLKDGPLGQVVPRRLGLSLTLQTRLPPASHRCHAWNDFRAEPEEFFIIHGERILVFVHNSVRGRTSGLELEQRSVANFFEIRDGRVTRFVLYWDRDRALADIGVTPGSTQLPT